MKWHNLLCSLQQFNQKFDEMAGLFLKQINLNHTEPYNVLSGLIKQF
jgi:hypothetical protein